LCPSTAGKGVRVSDEEMDCELCNSGHVGILLGIAASPEEILWVAIDAVNEYLHSVKICQGIWHVLAGDPTMNSGDPTEVASRQGLIPIRAVGECSHSSG
jgi:hypothetical protein